MLQEDFYQKHMNHLKIWRIKQWLRGLIVVLLSLMVLSGLAYAIYSGSSRQLVSFLSQQSFPFEAVIMEGIPGYTQPERKNLETIRNRGAALGMFLLTGVNVADPRTFFLGYFSQPPEGPAWLGWAYNPDDPEFEGPLLESIDVPQPAENPLPSPPASLTPGSKSILVGIYNTHNSECYAGDGGPERRQGENGDVVAVGATLKEALIRKGIGAVHSLQIHDGADFMKAYGASVKTATQMIKDYPSIKILLDIHRDGLPPGVPKSTVMVNGQNVSKVMVVIGKKNPHWENNEALAKKLITLGNEKYPGLFVQSISYAADARYNQHLSDGGLLLEFGSQLNTLKEAKGAAEAVAEILAEYLK